MQFTQSSVPQLYYADASLAAEANASGITPQVWFLLPQQSPQTPPHISVADSWATYTGGCYIFLDEALAADKEAAFAEAVWLYLSDPGLKAVRFAWFLDPNQTTGNLQSGNTIALYTPPDSTKVLTSLPASFAYQNLTLNVGINCPVSLNGDNSFRLAQARS